MTNTNETLIINAIDAERGETRIAYLKKQQLEKVYDLNDQNIITKGNIYQAKISSDVPSLEAYFVDYGEEKHGFLPYKDCIQDKSSETPKKYNINDKLLVQITKEERGNKGAALTAEITIPGTFLVLMPKSQNVRGISKNIDENARLDLEAKLKEIAIPENMGVIARTSAKNRSAQELSADLKYLLQVWQEIEQAASKTKENELIFQEHQGIHKLITETIRADLKKIVIDHEPTAEIIKNYVKEMYPELLENIVLHSSNVPIFTHYQIEDAIEAMYAREVALQSGGRIVIDRTEAMYTIDVNSAQATNAKTVENTALQTNLEAVRKTAQIMRLREINGIIAIDLIDMNESANKEAVIQEMRASVADDKSRVSIIGEISDLGILQLSRQRSKPSLSETHLIHCPTCSGRGYVRSPISFANSLLHIIEQHAIHGKSATLFVQTPINTATYICNEKYANLRAIEQRQNVNIKIIPNPQLEVPKYLIKRVRKEDANANHFEPSIIEKDYSKELPEKKTNKQPKVTTKHLPTAAKKKNTGLMQKILEMFSSDDNKPKENQKKPQQRRHNNRNRNQRSQRKPQQRKSNQQRRTPNNRRGPNANSVKKTPETNSIPESKAST